MKFPINYLKIIKILSITLILTPQTIMAESKQKEINMNKSLGEYSKEESPEKIKKEKEQNNQEIMDLVKNSLQGMVKPIEVFDGPGNIKGVVVANIRKDDNTLPVWVIDNKYVLLGDISDKKGNMRSREHYLDHVMSKKITKEALNRAVGIKLTEGKRKMIVFADPNCTFCGKLYQNIKKKGLQEFEKSGIQIEWIPVAILNPESSNKKGISILKGGAKAINKNTEEYSYATRKGGLKGEETQLNIEHATTITQNTNLLKKFDEGRGAMTPTIVWEDKKGKQHVQIGAPKELDMFFK